MHCQGIQDLNDLHCKREYDFSYCLACLDSVFDSGISAYNY